MDSISIQIAISIPKKENTHKRMHWTFILRASYPWRSPGHASRCGEVPAGFQLRIMTTSCRRIARVAITPVKKAMKFAFMALPGVCFTATLFPGILYFWYQS